MITPFHNKRIVLGITGSIAAYKAVDLASKLAQNGAIIDVILTQAAANFVTLPTRIFGDRKATSNISVWLARQTWSLSLQPQPIRLLNWRMEWQITCLQ